ncbi:ribosome rescue protein RqcH [Halorarius halobius]|uniref:ribosome rescue protein RqcH n=1 Tax=Halorarius halobius TaxID=2962671 RepID=UPI0020CD8F58|nr:ribosome rescue protein RqcH [Halorarius halobius]
MDQKRAMTSVDLAALVTELRGYEGAKVDKAYLYDDDLVRLKLRDFDAGRVELILETGDPKRAHVAAPEHVPDAPGRPPDFAKMLRNRLSGADLAGVRQYEFDRILVFEFERDDADTLLVVELFGDGNVAVMNRDREVIDCLDTVRLKSRTVAPGSVYEFPASRFNPMTADRETFGARMDDSDTDVVRTIATQLNLGGLWAEELCSRAGVEKTLDIAEATDDDYDELFGALERLRDTVREGRFDPRVYWETDEGERTQPVDATPVPLEEYEGVDCEAYDRFVDALDDYFYELDREEPTPGTDRPDFEEEIAKYERIIDQQEGAIEGFEQEAEQYRERAEAVYAHYDLVDEVLSTVREAREADYDWEAVEGRFHEAAEAGNERAEHVRDVNPAEGTVTVELDGMDVELDPQDGVEKNADRLYQEAKRVEEKKEGALAAIEDTREDLEDAKRRRDEWEADDGDDADEEADESEDVDWLSRSNIPVRYDEQWYERFRWFHTSDGFLVIGGRNADQNEALVKKYMDGGDRFFHSQAHGGPVTILKATGPSEPSKEVDFPESTLEEAARFAVTYSSVWKEGKFAGDVYMVDPDQVSKTPESGEYLEKGGFTIRGDRTYFRDTPVDCAVGVQCEPETRVLGGPKRAIEGQVETSVEIEPGQYAQNDIAKMLYRELKERFADQSFLRKVASPDLIQEFCPPGGSRIVD